MVSWRDRLQRLLPDATDLSTLAGAYCLIRGAQLLHPAAAWLVAGVFLAAPGCGRFILLLRDRRGS